MNFGNYNKLTILGGGNQFTIDILLLAIDIGYSVDVITSKRHSIDLIDNGCEFTEELDNIGISYIVVDDIKSKCSTSFIGDDNLHTLYLSIGAPWIFKKETINKIFNGMILNLHPTRLPQNRGGGSISWQIMTGNRFGFCAIHLIDNAIDSGEIVKMEEFIIPSSCRIPLDYIKIIWKRNLDFVAKFIADIKAGSFEYVPIQQAEYLSTYWPRLNQDTSSWIDWHQTPEQIDRFVCAFDDPYKGAITFIEGRKVRIKKVHVNYQDGIFHPYQTGLVFRKGSNWLVVALNGGSLIIESISDYNTNDSCMSLIQVGSRLSTPLEKLRDSTDRVFYSCNGLKK
jgi:hypothetical protein